MVAGRQATFILLGTLLCGGAGHARAGPAGMCRYAGRPLPEALADLRAFGLELIYSSDLVRPDMIVGTEPPVLSPRRVLDVLIAPFGLETRDGPGGRILIVRPAGGAGPDSSSSPRRPGGAGPLTTTPEYRERVEVNARASAAGGDQPEPRTTLTREDLGRPAQLGGDPNRTIGRLPGIASGDKSAALTVRGGDSDEALFVLDGLAIDEPFHLKDFLGFSSIVDARALRSADVLTGVFPAEYGDRMSGVIDFSTIDPQGAGRTVAGASLINSNILSAGTWHQGDGQWLVSARSWYPDMILDIVDPGGEDINPSYQDLLGKVQVRLARGSVLSAHFLAARDTLDYLADLKDARVRAGEDNRYAWINIKTPWTARLYSQTVLSRGWLDRSRRGSVVGGSRGEALVRDERSSSFLGFKQDWIFGAGGRSSLKWGASARRVAAEYDYRSHVEYGDPAAGGVPPAGADPPAAMDRVLALAPSGSELGAYVAERLRVLAPLTLEMGLRWDRRTLTAEDQLSPRLNLLYALGPRTSLRAGWGLFHQSHGINELQVEDGVGVFFPAESAEHRQVGFDHRFAAGLTLGVSAYDKEMSQLHPRYENLFDPIQLFPESEPDRVRIAPDRALARGIEIVLGMDRGRPLSWRAGYALASVEDEIDGVWVPRSWDQRHALDFDMNYRRGGAWEFNLSGKYRSGWPTTAVRAESVQNPDGTSAIRPIVGPRNAERYPPYHRLDFKMSRRLPLDHGTLTLFLEVTNLYGRNNVCCVGDFRYTPQADGTVRVERDERYWLRLLPVAGLTWEF